MEETVTIKKGTYDQITSDVRSLKEFKKTKEDLIAKENCLFRDQGPWGHEYLHIISTNEALDIANTEIRKLEDKLKDLDTIKTKNHSLVRQNDRYITMLYWFKLTKWTALIGIICAIALSVLLIK